MHKLSWQPINTSSHLHWHTHLTVSAFSYRVTALATFYFIYLFIDILFILLLFFDNGYYRDILNSLSQNSVGSKAYYFIVFDPLNNWKTWDSFKLGKIIFVNLQVHSIDKSELEEVREKVFGHIWEAVCNGYGNFPIHILGKVIFKMYKTHVYTVPWRLILHFLLIHPKFIAPLPSTWH